MGGLIVAAIVITVLAVLAYSSLRVVKQSERLVIFRLGRADPRFVKSPGLAIVIPIIDRGVAVDMRERRYEISVANAPTSDDGAMSADLTIRCRVVDPFRCVINVVDLDVAMRGVTATSFQKVAAESPRGRFVGNSGALAAALEAKLSEVTEHWGVSLTNVEVRGA